MIQRIQSLYLLLVLVITGFILSTTMLTFTSADGLFTLSPYRLINPSGDSLKTSLPLATLFHLCFVLILSAIFFYKKRMIQIRLSIFSMVLYVGSYALIFYYYYAFKRDFDLTFYSVKVGVILPLINVILLILAIRSIGKDEALIRSLNRIR